MKSIACLVVVAACQRGDTGAAPPQPSPDLPRAAVSADYRDDITTLCDVVRLSKADAIPRNERWPIIAMWLGPHIKTPEAHTFLVAIQPLVGEPKARALETEARRVGLADCALATEWHGSAASPP